MKKYQFFDYAGEINSFNICNGYLHVSWIKVVNDVMKIGVKTANFLAFSVILQLHFNFIWWTSSMLASFYRQSFRDVHHTSYTIAYWVIYFINGTIDANYINFIICFKSIKINSYNNYLFQINKESYFQEVFIINTIEKK